MSEFKNMKILITPEQQLSEVTEELEQRGYKKCRWGGFIDERFRDCSIRTFENGMFTDMKSKQVYCYGYKEVTLAELKGMKL